MSAYDTVVLSDSPLGYWKMAEASGTTMNDSSGNSHNGTYTASGVTLGVAGIGDGETAASFNGTSGAASVAINLSAQNKVTLEFWMKQATWLTNDAFAAEYTTNFNTQAGSFAVDANSSATAGSFDFGNGSGSSTYNDGTFVHPSAAAWHYYALVLDRTISTKLPAYVDGAAVSVTQVHNTLLNNVFANSTLYLMSRATTSLFNAGQMAKVAIYAGDLSATRIAAHFAAVGQQQQLMTMGVGS